MGFRGLGLRVQCLGGGAVWGSGLRIQDGECSGSETQGAIRGAGIAGPEGFGFRV